MTSGSAPLSDTIITVISHLVDDAQTGTRKPSHSELEHEFQRTGLINADPSRLGNRVGKAKRVRGILSWALEHEPTAGERLVAYLIALVRGVGGFREKSPNFVGHEPIQNAQAAFRREGYDLTHDGDLLPLLLDNLSGLELIQALRIYIRRAKRGAEDAALVTGSGKDLLEATAAHVLVQRFGTYSGSTKNFPTVLGQAFTCVGLNTQRENAKSAQDKIDSALYQLACAVNNLRNHEGTGHGRPFLPNVTPGQARTAIESMGIVAERLLDSLEHGP